MSRLQSHHHEAAQGTAEERTRPMTHRWLPQEAKGVAFWTCDRCGVSVWTSPADHLESTKCHSDVVEQWRAADEKADYWDARLGDAPDDLTRPVGH